MRNKAESKKSQSGQILLYTTIILMLAALILVPLMNFTFSSHRSATIRTQRTLELYATDAGIEDALYQIKTETKGTALANLGFGNTYSYNPGTPAMNDRTENVTVQKVWLPQDLPANATIPNKPGNPAKNWTNPAPVNNDTTPSLDTDKSDKLVVVGMFKTVQAIAAADDFDHGWPGGSSGGNWTGNWTTTGSASLASGGNGGGFCLNFTGAAGTAMRQMTLPKYLQPELKFDAKASSLGSGGNASCQVSTDGGNWTTVATWASGNGTYSSFDIDLYDPPYNIGGYDEAKPLWVRFDANLSTLTIAHDNFDAGFPAGYPGEWVGNWAQSGTGTGSIVSTGIPYSGSYHLRITQSRRVYRQVLNFSSLSNPKLYLWIKGSGFSSSDIAYVDVSTKPTPNPSISSDWTTVKTLRTSTTPTLGNYTLYQIDLSSYKGASNFWISLRGAMGSTSTFASEGFENGLPGGDTGIYWIGNWTTGTGGNGDGAVNISTSYVHGGSGALQLSRSGSASGSASATATRIVNVSGQDNLQLQFYARSRSIESSGDTLTLQLSPDGVNWTTTTVINNTSYNNGYGYFTYAVPQAQYTTGRLYIRFNANMTWAGSSDTSDYFYIDDISVVGNPYYYVDDVSVSGSSSFSVDNVWIGYQSNSNNIEIAYTNPDFDTTVGSPGINDPAYLDRIGVWMPPGCEYVGVVGNQTTQGLNQVPDILPATYAGGTILEWDFSPTINLAVAPVGSSFTYPIIWDLTFSYSMPPTQVVQGMFIWIKAHGPGSQTYLSWDQGYEIYKAVSKAHSQILGTNTQVAAYAGQGEVNKNGAASYGDYVASGSALLFDYDLDGNGVKEKAVNPSDPYTWVTQSGFLYNGRDQITSIPSDAKVTAAWLYWSAFMKNSDWASFGSQPDTTVSFMYPKRYGPETFAVYAGDGNNSYTTAAWGSAQESMDLLAHQPVLTLSQVRYLGEVLGNATAGNGNDTFWTAHQSIQSPAPTVRVGGVVKSQGGNYTINYATGNVTIINDTLSGPVTIDYWASGSKTLTKGTDYAITQNVLGQDIRYTGFTVGNDTLQGNVTIDYYYAKHWETVQHAAYDKYGTVLAPVQTMVPLTNPVGHTYACFDDVTQLLTGNGTYAGLTGDGQYAVCNVAATTGVNNTDYATRCFSGWSLVVLFESPTGTAHQFYLWDPIHNAAECPFMVQPNTDFSPQPDYVNVPFTLNDFYPPEGTVTGKVTYFVGEGDVVYDGDSIGFKGASQTSYTFLSGPNNPVDNVMNCVSTNGQSGIDIDTYDVLGQVGNDTQANVLLRTQGDRWYLTYMILSFNTNVVPPPDYSFNVASITYQYQLGGK